MDLCKVGSTRVDEPGLNLGLALPFHMAVNPYIRVVSCERMAFVWVWVFCLIILHSIMWLRRRCAARRSLRLTMDMAWEVHNRHHKTARARIRLLLFESKLRRLSTAYLQQRTVCVRYRSHSFRNKIAGNWSERES